MKKKRNFQFIIFISLIFCCFVNTRIFAIESTDNPVTLEGSILYANGNDITLKKGGDGKVYLYDQNNIKLIESSVSISTIYGGSKNKNVIGNVNITLDSVNVANVYGGGYSDGSAPANVTGDVKINVKGQANAGSINGGGNAKAEKGDAQANISGSVSIDILAMPTQNHGNIYGGGYAFSSTANSATANVGGNISVYITGRTYSVQGGGRASTNLITNGQAIANVSGDISIAADAVDIREVYGAGYASKHAQANCRNVNVKVYNNSEIMILAGGGRSYEGAIAQSNDVFLSLLDCINIYGYVRVGGYAYNGGKSDIHNSSLIIKNSLIPADTQFDNIVAAGIYGGGEAYGSSSNATTNSVVIDMQNCETAGTIYSGGESHSASNAVGFGNAKVKSAKAYYANNIGSLFEGQIYQSTVIAQGNSENNEMASVGESEIKVVDSDFDGIWGSGENMGNPFAMIGKSKLNVVKELYTNSVAGFDSLVIEKPLHVQTIMGKSETQPSMIIVSDNIKVGTPLIYCDEILNMKDVFVIEDNQLDYLIKGNQSIWQLGQMTYTITTKSHTGGNITASQKVNKFASSTITWATQPGYQVDKVLIDGKAIAINSNSYIFNDIRQNHTIEIMFKKIPGTIKDEVLIETKPGQDIPQISVDLSDDKINELLSEEDRKLIAEGKNIQFTLAIDTLKTISQKEQLAIDKLVKKENVLMTFDINFLKNIDGHKSNIKELSSKLKIVMDIPKQYLSNNKNIAILRIHQNEDGSLTSEILKDLDNNINTITFETDQFSIYSLIYDVTETDIPSDKDQEVDNKIVETNDISLVSFYIVVFTLSMICFYSLKRKD